MKKTESVLIELEETLLASERLATVLYLRSGGKSWGKVGLEAENRMSRLLNLTNQIQQLLSSLPDQMDKSGY